MPVLAMADDVPINKQAGAWAYRRAIATYNPHLSAEQLDEIVRSILHYSTVFKIDPRLVIAVIATESGFRPAAASESGIGLGQLSKRTARQLQVDPSVPSQNIHGTVRLLKLYLQRFANYKKRDQYRLCLASYNLGYDAVQHVGHVPASAAKYVDSVMREYSRLSGEK